MVERDGLRIEFRLQTPRVLRLEHVLLGADFTNVGAASFRLDVRLLEAPSLVLRLRRTERPGVDAPVPMGPPPLPPDPDDTSGLVALPPGQTLSIVYNGTQLSSGRVLPAGSYAVRFKYDKRASPHEEWHGQIQTEWLAFQLDPP